MTRAPSTNGANGRDSRGRFVKGNRGGPGNPHARRVAKLRSALLRAVSADEVRGIVQALVSKARAGDVPAARMLLEYVIGRPKQDLQIEQRQVVQLDWDKLCEPPEPIYDVVAREIEKEEKKLEGAGRGGKSGT